MNWIYGTFIYLLTTFIIYHCYDNDIGDNYINTKCVRITELKCNADYCCFKYQLKNTTEIYAYACYPANWKNEINDIYYFDCYYDIRMPDELTIGYFSTSDKFVLQSTPYVFPTLIYMLFSMYKHGRYYGWIKVVGEN